MDQVEISELGTLAKQEKAFLFSYNIRAKVLHEERLNPETDEERKC